MKNFLIVIFLLIMTQVIVGQEIFYNTTTQVNTYTSSNQFLSDVSILLDGKIIICWEGQGGQDGDSGGIFAQLFDSSFTKIGIEFRVNTTTVGYQSRPRISKLYNGGFVISWQSDGQDGDGFGVFGQIYDNNCKQNGQEFQINSYTKKAQQFCDLTGLKNNNFVVCWQSDDQDGSNRGIYCRLYGENGNALSDEIEVNSDTFSEQWAPQICEWKENGFVVFWNDSKSHNILSQKFDFQGEKVGEEYKVNCTSYYRALLKGVTNLGNNGFVVSWMGSDSDWLAKLYLQIFDENGVRVDDEKVVEQNFSYWNNSDLTLLNDNRFIICWQKETKASKGSIWNKFEVLGQLFDNNCETIGQQFQVCEYDYNGDGYNQKVSLSNFDNESFVISWDQPENFGNDYSGVFGKFYFSEPINHRLEDFEISTPQTDQSFITTNPNFLWYKATETHINFPWEITYNLYISTNETFSEPLIVTGIEDTTYQVDPLEPGNTYFWKVLARNYYGDSLWSSNVNGFFIEENATDIEDEEAIPQEFELYQNYPNPFNPTTTIRYTIPSAVKSENSKVKIVVYDILGREVKTLANKIQSAGSYQVDLNASELPSGVYYYQLKYGEFIQTKKMVLLK